MKTSDFKPFMTALLEHNKSSDKLNVTLAGIYSDKVTNAKYCKWVTGYAYNNGAKNEVIAQSVKKFQNRLNKSATQRLCFGLGDKETLTHKIRLVRANKPLTEQGYFTQTELQSTVKPFKFIKLVNDKPEKTFEQRLQKLVDSYKLTKAQVVKKVDKITFA